MDWFRLYNEFATDPKVQMMSEAMQRRLVMLFCLQCSNGIETFHETERDVSIAFAMRISDEELAATKAEFMRRGFIDEGWLILNWSKRQYASDSSTARVRAHREKKKQESKHDETLQERSGNALEQIQNRTDKEEAYASVDGAAQSAPPIDLDPLPGDAASPAPMCPADAIVDLYHRFMPDNPRCKVLNDARRKSIRARWKEAARLQCPPFGYSNRESGLKAWAEFFSVCAGSEFLTGRAAALPGKPPFVADIDFLMSPAGFAKTLENKYHREAQQA